MKIAVIILNYFGFQDTCSCVKSVRENLDAQFFLVDNSADPEERKKLEGKFQSSSDVRLLFPPENLGFAAGVNLALKKSVSAGFQYFLLLNNDAVLANEAGDIFNKAFKEHPGSFLSPTIIWGENISSGNYYQKYLGLISTLPYFHGLGSLYYFTGCALCFDKAALDKVGYLDESFFFYGEDVEYSYRAKRNNVPFILLPEELVNHEGSKSARMASFFYEFHLVHSQYLLSLKIIENPFNKLLSLLGKFITLSVRAFIRCIRYKSFIPIVALFAGVFPLKVRPQIK